MLMRKVSAFIMISLALAVLRMRTIMREIRGYNKKNIIICGVEAHICVLQTVD
jgi:nicotinamidase-related amidase